MIEITGMRPKMMLQGKTSARASRTAALRIETVDNWHASWDAVVGSIKSFGKPRKLKIDGDGWLSARQVITVAFVGDVPVAHVCFSVAPTADGCIEATLDSYGINPRFTGRGIESQLHEAA